MNRRARRRSGLVLAAAALSAAVWAYKPLERRAASQALERGLAAAREGDAVRAAADFNDCLKLRPGREDCTGALKLAERVVYDAEQERQRSSRQSEWAAVLADARSASRVLSESPAAGEPSEEDKRRAIKHWNEGIKLFQQNEYAKAKDEWQLCKRFDPENTDCGAGLARLEGTFGGGL